MRDGGSRRAGALVGATLLAAVACTTEPLPDAPRDSAYSSVTCPAEVSSLMVAQATCGYLTVPENRADPGRTIRLFVTRVPPPDAASAAEPILVPGTDLGDVLNIAGIAPMAQRTGREVIILDPRGVGLSEPVLDCPEVRELSALTLSTAVDDPATRNSYLDAVTDCHAQLTADGIDVAAYNLTEMAADAEDLRRALDVPSWNVATFGTSSRITFEMLRGAPEPIRAVLMDSPEWPGLDPREVGAAGTEEALAAVFGACDQDASCRAAFPRGRASLDLALEQLDRNPVSVTPRAGVGTGGVRFDAAALLHVLRQAMSGDSIGGPYRAEAVPSVIADVLSGRPDAFTSLAEPLVGDDPYCNGYHPRCSPDGRSVSGVDYTVLCHDIAPFSSPAGSPTDERTGFGEAFARSPYLDVCTRWPVGQASRQVAEPARSDVPVLAMVGAFDPYVRPASARDGLAGLEHLTLVVDLAGGHNVMPRTDCMLGIRQTWLDDPTKDPATDCLATIKPDWPSP